MADPASVDTDPACASTEHPLSHTCVHLCVDMQRMFAEATDWRTPWMPRVLPRVERLVAAHPDRTIFTRFVPPDHPGEGRGAWGRYFERWASMTGDNLAPGMVDLVPSLARYVPPAQVVDKRVYSPWIGTDLDARLQARGIDTLVVTGAETDVCVLAAVLGGVDLGYRIVLVTDGLCSSCDEAHDALMVMYRMRYGCQVETQTADAVLARWR
ncbi:isochorismatase family cysteine hydrolase [Methylobacterium sp. NEAU 140]|uniref:cysteine hydrolase family protein n=1 Tax=Methylobacterium sp. NEAU 140 TaxID=3064945 RepID=UPI002732C6C5|nr:isochorismatase family cysteine hydrolase [Methylobacterium sp. NEAU 140]MDP4021084.1 isochorismatase family cysteine hydrolase [Methylobacterium sp. NEAU 140]